MNIRTYNQISVQMLRATQDPQDLVDIAAQHCMKQPKDIQPSTKLDNLIHFLLEADHTNPMEHCVLTFLVDGFSRSGLAQLTRHRIASYTVTSQHYQDYSDYPFVISNVYKANEIWEQAFQSAMMYYHRLIKDGVPKEEARQVLPNAMSCGFVMTINARSLINFLRLRLCKRNCAEIMNLAWELKYQATAWFPLLFSKVHAPCWNGKCNQGRMSCGRPYGKAENSTSLMG